METEEKRTEETIGEMRKRREIMADGRRYIVYYKFENDETEPQKEVSENV